MSASTYLSGALKQGYPEYFGPATGGLEVDNGVISGANPRGNGIEIPGEIVVAACAVRGIQLSLVHHGITGKNQRCLLLWHQ